MTMNEFYQAVEDAIKEEHDAGSLYISLAKDSPDECDKKTLMEMAKQEIMHRANLEWIHMKKGMY